MRGRSNAWVFAPATFITLGLASGILPAQLTVCDGLNEQTPSFSGAFGLPPQRTLGVRYVPTTALVIDRLEFFYAPLPGYSVDGGTVEIRPEDPMTGLPAAMQIEGTTTWTGTQPGPAWDGGTFPTPVFLAGSQPYWLITTAAPISPHQAPAYEDVPAGPNATPYAISPSPGAPYVLSAVPHNFKARLLGANCFGLPPAAASFTIVGDGCPGTNGIPQLNAAGLLPSLGNAIFYLQIQNAAPGALSSWFIAASASVNSAVLAPGCNVHLELSSLFLYATQGLNPLFTLQADSGGYVQLPLPIPNDPTLVGLRIAVQVHLTDPGTANGFTLTAAAELGLGI